MSSDNSNIHQFESFPVRHDVQSLTQQTGHLSSVSSFSSEDSSVPMNQLTNDTCYDNSHLERWPFNSNNEDINVPNVNLLDVFKSHIEQLRTFSKDYIEYLDKFVDKYGIDLLRMPLRAEFQKFMEDCRKNPEMSWSQEGFQFVSSILKNVQSNEQQSLQNMNSNNFSEEATGTSEMSTSAPAEENHENMDAQIQASSQPKLPTSTVPKDNESKLFSIALSQFIAQEQSTVQESDLADLFITDPPMEVRKHRTINCLKNGECPLIRGQNSKQREGFGIEWTELTGDNFHTLFVLIQAVAANDQSHPCSILVPDETTVNESKSSEDGKNNGESRLTLGDLIIPDGYGCDINSRTVLCPIIPQENKQRAQTMKIRMFSSYKPNGKKRGTVKSHAAIAEDKLRKSTKLRICICRRNDQGKLVPLTKFIYTGPIKENKGEKSSEDTAVIPENVHRQEGKAKTVTFNTQSLTDVEQHSHLTRQRANKRSSSKSRSEKSSQTSFSNKKVSKLRKTQRNQMDVDPSHDPPSDSVPIINIIDREENDDQQSKQENAGVILWDEQFEVEHEEEVN